MAAIVEPLEGKASTARLAALCVAVASAWRLLLSTSRRRGYNKEISDSLAVATHRILAVCGETHAGDREGGTIADLLRSIGKGGR